MAVTVNQRSPSHSTSSTTVADLLERLLDKGVVVAGDIRVKLVEVELLTLEIRLLICSVDKAVEMGLDWWRGNPAFDTSARGAMPARGAEPREAPPAAAAALPASAAWGSVHEGAPGGAEGRAQAAGAADPPAQALAAEAVEQRLARIEALLAERMQPDPGGATPGSPSTSGGQG
jgi:hypothetical protein